MVAVPLLQKPRLAAAMAAALGIMAIPSGPAMAAACAGVTFGAGYTGYQCNSLGSLSGLSGPYGGIAFLDNDTLLIGDNALSSSGTIDSVGIIRGAGGHIIGFSGPATSYANAPNIDGGLAFGPGGVLFYTIGSGSQVGEIEPGSTSTTFAALPSGMDSGGALVFVPPGFAGAGGMKFLSYGNGKWYDASLTADGTGTYSVSAIERTTISDGGEGVVYIGGANAGFGGTDSVIVSSYAYSQLTAYQLDDQGDPIAATANPFLIGLADTEGAVIDPLTGDELFTNRDNQIVVISGFLGPAVPEPATITLFGLGLGATALLRRRRSAHRPNAA